MPAEPDLKEGPSSSPLQRFVAGFVLGLFVGMAAQQLGVGEVVPQLRNTDVTVFVAVAAGLLALRCSLRRLFIPTGVVAAFYLLVAFTPVTTWLIKPWPQRPGIQHLDAVVVLSAQIYQDGSLPIGSQQRLLEGYRLIAAGATHWLVVTRMPLPAPSYVPTVASQLQSLRLQCNIVETSTSVDTHDEAIAVHALARSRGWRVLGLVTDPSHMRRAVATFAKQGLIVVPYPSVEQRFDAKNLAWPDDRLLAFRIWIREWIGLRVYRWRGWV